MDMDKFYELLTNDESLQDIPLLYIIEVAIVVFEIINSGKCNYEIEDI